jgi:hypothetical protein
MMAGRHAALVTVPTTSSVALPGGLAAVPRAATPASLLVVDDDENLMNRAQPVLR